MTLSNKHIEKDDTTAYLYKNTSTGWIEFLGTDNKFNLYKPSQTKETYSTIDGRVDNTNADIVYEYMLNLDNQDNQGISTSALKNEIVFCENPIMSNDTFHRALNKLVDFDKVNKIGKGIYKINDVGENEGENERENISGA
jgi:hypothetical protein